MIVQRMRLPKALLPQFYNKGAAEWLLLNISVDWDVNILNLDTVGSVRRDWSRVSLRPHASFHLRY